MIQSLNFNLQLECESEAVVEDAVKTSLIESVVLDLQQVRNSVARQLGLPYAGLLLTSRSVDGLVQILLDATHDSGSLLTDRSASF